MDTTITQENDWKCLRSQTGRESDVLGFLHYNGIEAWLPRQTVKVPRRGEMTLVERPLFSSYVFIKHALDGPQASILQATPYVYGFVKFGGKYAVIHDSDVHRVNLMLESGAYLTVWDTLRIGQRVRVKRGSLEGSEFEIASLRGETHVIVRMDMFGRCVSVPLCLSDVELL